MTAMLSDPIFTVQSDPIGAQKSPVTLALADGGFAVCWLTGSQLMTRLFSADGQPRSGDILLASGVAGYTGALGADGQMRLVWATGTPAGWGIKSLTLAPDGTSSPGATLTADRPGPASTPQILGLTDGFYVAWSEANGDQKQLMQLRLDDQGIPSDPVPLLAQPALLQGNVRLTPTSHGGFLACWEQVNPLGYDVVAARFDASGTPLGPPFALNQNLTGWQGSPAVTELADGDLLAAWADESTGTAVLWARRFSADGTAKSDAFMVDPAQMGSTQIRLVALSDGGYAVLWDKAAGEYGDLWIQRFDAQDQILGAATCLHDPDPTQQAHLSVTLLADGRLLAAWTQGTNPNTDIMARILDLRVSQVNDAATLTGAQHLTQLMAQGASLTIAEDAALTLLNQHGIQSTGPDSAGVTVAGRIEVSASFGDFAAIRLLGQDGSNWISVAATGQVVAKRGAAVELAGDLNALTNAGLIDGSRAALIGAEGRDSVVNTGLMRGSVQLMAGDDTFDCRLGRLEGIVEGGLGNDLYLIGANGLSITERAGEGQDRVQTLKSLTLANHIERLDLLGSAHLWATGNAQANLIKGNTGNNRLIGFGGADSLQGGAGNDRLTGGQGIDQLTGGQGADRFVFATKADSNLRQPDTITDFRPGQDKIDVSTLTGPKLRFFGTDAFDGEHAGVRLIKAQGWRVEIDLNADGRADLALQINLTKPLTEADFIL
ncbi:calcium-binding protein [Neogemmobacter tilapiae]|uniref:Peptidase M10 serralysin C-terminal domain-containing protein n=1 Tax=Neogemmobacter tilapiae TaxID=875041 RepID=A0A918TS60_9RHOB|nr:calcium-binding protein [Gemmobacter tilapiae]GHC54421.1 hypothetical protein GCM10007315_16660 [Gemmobacter tilapiae]